jgi:phosphomannomutase/phosphoglucomutase
MKMVRSDAKPISSDSGLKDIAQRVEANIQPTSSTQGKYTLDTDKAVFAKYLLDFTDISQLKPLKIVVNPGNSSAGLVLDLLEPHLPFEFVKICYEADGTFPNGIPNPLLPENRSITSQAVLEHQADLGIAWDGDFDRCFFFDASGSFVEGYYLVGLLAQALLENNPGESIIYDPRLTWNTQEMVQQLGGKALQSKAGHAFIKDAMREHNAIYGGEMSAHHYFRDFAYCDSGMLPWLLLTSYLSTQQAGLSSLIKNAVTNYPCSGEINFTVADSQAVISKIKDYYLPHNPQLDTTDGLGVSFDAWRFNVRASNTEPLLRLNVETRANQKLLSTKIAEITQLIQANT